MLSVVAFVKVELYLSWMKFFQARFFFYSFLFLFIQGLARGHCLGMVTIADSVTHKYFHRYEKDGSC
jgi:hypothetical protein